MNTNALVNFFKNQKKKKTRPDRFRILHVREQSVIG